MNIIKEKTNYTYKQLWNIARERKIKYFRKYNKNELERMLGFEISKPNEKHEKYCREKLKNPVSVIAINNEMDEILHFKSLLSAARNFNMNPESIKLRIKRKKDLKFNGKSFLIFYDQVGI